MRRLSSRRPRRVMVTDPGQSAPIAASKSKAVERTSAAVRRDAGVRPGLASIAGGWSGSDELASLIPPRRRRR